MPKTCDNACVGVVIIDRQHPDGPRYLLFERKTPPVGIAPVAGHVDTHGSARDAAIAEASEELGLTIERLDQVWEGWLPNRCRRVPGTRGVGHTWTVFTAEATGRLTPAPREAAAPRWASAAEIGKLAARTASYGRGEISLEAFRADPGLEPVWVLWFSRMGVIEIGAGTLETACSLFK